MTILLAVSGGIDSMYLLHRAPELFPGASFAIAHCNFSLRGEESDGDEQFVRQAAQDLGLELHTIRFDTKAYCAENGASIEMGARDLRYEWFAKICATWGYDAVAVAHNADDNAETLLLNILRGCGSKGLCGMQSDSLRGGLRILRPILDVERTEILRWMKENGKQWREDSTNGEDTHKRNVLRHKVIPVLKELNPDLAITLGRNMKRWRETDAIADRYYREAVVSVGATPDRMPVSGLLKMESWKYVLWRWSERCGFSQETFDAMCGLLESNRTFSGKTFESPTHVIETSTGFLTIRSGKRTSEELQPVDIPGPGTYRFGERILEVHTIARGKLKSVKAPEGTVYFDSSKAPFPLRLRPWKNGDRLSPIGMKGSKKLSDIYGEAGLSREEKAGSIVIESSGKVICAFPMRTDKSVRIEDPDTSEVISISEL